jgi:hypothetical protein
MIQKRSFVPEEVVATVLDECIARSKIIAVSRRTAAENAGRIRQGSSTKKYSPEISGLLNYP